MSSLLRYSELKVGFRLSEFFAENLGDFFIFLRRFADDILETSAESLEQILNFITVFMGNVERYVTFSAVIERWKPFPRCSCCFFKCPIGWRTLIWEQSLQRCWRLWCPTWSRWLLMLLSQSCFRGRESSAPIDTRLSWPRPSSLCLLI